MYLFGHMCNGGQKHSLSAIFLKGGITKGGTNFLSNDFVWGADNSEQIPGSGECLSTFHKYSLMSYEILFTCLLSLYLD